MSRKSVSVLCHWGGTICDDNEVGVSYIDGQRTMLRVKTKGKFIVFLSKVHTLTGFDCNIFKISVVSRYPYRISPNNIQYMRLNVDNDDTLDAVLCAVSDNDILQCLEVYLEIEPRFPTEEANCPTVLTSPVREGDVDINTNYGFGFEAAGQTSSSQQHINDTTPVQAVQAVVLNENFDSAYFVREDADDQIDEEEDEEERFMEEIDADAEEGESDDDDHVGPSNEAYRLHEPPSSFFTNIGADIPAEYYVPHGAQRASDYDFQREELYKGLIFKNKELLKGAVASYNITRMKEYSVAKSTTTLFEVICKKKSTTGCPWKLRGSLLKKHTLFEVVTYTGPHTCVYPIMNEDHAQLDAEMIGNCIKNFILEDPSFKVSAIQTAVKEQYNYHISYFKAWYAKQKVIASIFGDWENSYTKLPKYMQALQRYNPDTIVEYGTTSTPNPDKVIFERLFWSFGACIKAFVHLRPLLCIDATHMYGKYKGRLLIAQGLDANRNVLPLAFAFVDEENADNWGWFLRLIRNYCVTDREICLISDRHAGILAAVRNPQNGWLPPLGHHRFCLRHFQSNFMTKFKNNALKLLVWEAGTQTQLRKFNAKMQTIRDINPRAYTWLMAADPVKWTFVHDGGRRWGEATTNIVESFNGVLKGARCLPITACVQIIFFRLVNYFEHRRGVGIKLLQSNVTITADAVKRFTRYQTRSGGHNVRTYNRQTGETAVITRRGNTQVVIVDQNSCTCGKWETFKIPCSHVIMACRHLGRDSMMLVHEALTIGNYIQTYAPELHPLHHEDYWQEFEGPSWIPDQLLLRARGRPRSSRFTNEMDVRTNSNLCGICRVPGHDRRTCPTSAGQRSAGRQMH